jgi:exodeoxyribonuclease VII small subunit
MSTSPSSNSEDIEKMRFEAAASELEGIIERIEHGEIELEDSLESYRRGLALVRRCRGILDEAGKAIETASIEELESEDGSDG